MRNDDWDVAILHYLGLDHIGHLSGPLSSLMPNKLDEMGNVIEKINEVLREKVRKERQQRNTRMMGLGQ